MRNVEICAIKKKYSDLSLSFDSAYDDDYDYT